MNTTVPHIDIPGDGQVAAPASGKAWRFANGKIARGPEMEDRPGCYTEERPTIIGQLKRVGVFHGRDRDGNPYGQLELDIETRDGLVHVKSGLTDQDGNIRPSVATLTLARAIIEVEADAMIQITAVQGAAITLPNGKKGGKPTYVNVARLTPPTIEGRPWRCDPIYGEKRPPGAPKLDARGQWEEILPRIEGHPAYAERLVESDETQLMALEALCHERLWPTPTQFPAEWLAMSAKALKLPKTPASLSEISDEDWGLVLESLRDRKEIPGPLKGLTVTPATPEYDPFEDQ